VDFKQGYTKPEPWRPSRLQECFRFARDALAKQRALNLGFAVPARDFHDLFLQRDETMVMLQALARNCRTR
jgi:hypothetical protein